MSLRCSANSAVACLILCIAPAWATQPEVEPPAKPAPTAEPKPKAESKPTAEAKPEVPPKEETQPRNEAPPKNPGEPLTPLGKLPWEKPESKPPVLPAKRIESARELLLTYGIDKSQLANFFNNQPLGPGEEETLYRILFRLRYFKMANLERWQEKSVSWSDLATKPDDHRAAVFQVSGRVKRVVRVPVLAEVAERFEYDHYFQIFMQLDGEAGTALICARQIPEAWPLDAPLDERADCLGLFLKLGEPRETVPEFVFAAWRMAWRPERAEPKFGITEDLQWLASQGMDVGLFDAPRALNQKPLHESEGECFYSLLATLGRVNLSDLNKHAVHLLDIGPLLQDPQKHHGDVSVVRGNARRVQKIILGDQDRDFQERFGLDHYYQVDVFVPLGDKRIQFSKGPKDKEGPVFANNFLITLCVLKMPEGLEEGKELDVEVRLPAVFYKNWEFRSKYVEQFGKGEWKMQPAPMFVGVEPAIVVREKASGSNPYSSTGVLVVVIVSLIGILYGLWQFGRESKTSRCLPGESEPNSVGPPK